MSKKNKAQKRIAIEAVSVANQYKAAAKTYQRLLMMALAALVIITGLQAWFYMYPVPSTVPEPEPVPVRSRPAERKTIDMDNYGSNETDQDREMPGQWYENREGGQDGQ